MYHTTLCPGHFVRMLLCYRMGASSGVFFVNKLTLPLVDFKMNVIKWKLHFVSCNFGLKFKLAITNRTPASRSCDFVITRLISDQIALHSGQLPLLIALFLTNQIAGNTIDFKMNVIKPISKPFLCEFVLWQFDV